MKCSCNGSALLTLTADLYLQRTSKTTEERKFEEKKKPHFESYMQCMRSSEIRGWGVKMTSHLHSLHGDVVINKPIHLRGMIIKHRDKFA
jgi:hypothetical protein